MLYPIYNVNVMFLMLADIDNEGEKVEHAFAFCLDLKLSQLL